MNRTWHKLAFFTILYFVQGAAFAFVGIFQKPYLAGRGIDKETLGFFTSMLLLPFILKVFLGMLSDRVPLGRFGSRKPYMLLGLFAFAVCYFLLASVDPERHFIEFAALTFVASVGLALFDTCCDGWAIDVAREDEQSAVQAAMVGGRALGFIAASLLFGFVAESLGYRSIFSMLSMLASAVALVVAFSPYHPLGGGQLHPSRTAPWNEFRDWLRPAYILFAFYGVMYAIASFGTDGIITLYLADTRLSNAMDIGFFGVFRGIGALAGAIVFVRFERHYASHRVIGGALFLLGAGCLLPLLTLPIPLAGSLWGFTYGLQETAFVTMAMKMSRGAWAATFFALCMIFSNVGTALGEAIAAPVAGRAGYAAVFIGFAALAWVMALAMPRLFHKFKVGQ